MSRILPFKSEVEVSRDSPRVISLEGEESEAVFSALASDTARAIYRSLYEDPATASDVAEEIDTSVQNVRYHLEKLEDAGLIDEVDTWYSSRGNEMSVYAAVNEALIVAGDRHQQSELRSLFKTSAGALALLAVVSAIVHGLATMYLTDTLETQSEEAGIQAEQVTETVDVLTLEPGLLVFLGGLAIIAVFAVARFWSIRRAAA